MRRALRPFALLLAGLVSCAGEARAPGSPPPGPAPPSVATATAATPAAAPACRGGAPAPVFHRLNRTEYHNTVNELLGTRLPLREQLPADSPLFGFDNHADTAVSAPLVQRYLDAATRAVEAALAAPASRARLIPCDLSGDPDPAFAQACARRALEAFLPRAFRRPVSPAEVDEHLRYLAVCDENEQVASAGLACALEAALVSPDFLFRSELVAAPACAEPGFTAGGDGALGAYALASRLAFFLWSSAPDGELLDLAASGRLGDPAVIEAQVNRMLDPAAQGRFTRALVESLPEQWLGLAGLEHAAAADPGLDHELREAMGAESRRFFAEILQQNRSALELVQAPFTFANQRLAVHYGLPGVAGPVMRRVDTAGLPRGGVLTQASFLTLTSSSGKPSIPARGRWVLQNLLCTPLDDPPPGAQEMVPAPDASLGLSSRDSLARRTAGAACNPCHALLDPIGFGLAIFDAVGAERATENGRPIDASGVLPSGERFADTGELMGLLARDPRFPACLTRKMLTYALGRGLDGACDEAVVSGLAEELAADGFRLKNHVVRVAKSELFRTARRRP